MLTSLIAAVALANPHLAHHPQVAIVVEGRGTMVMELYPEEAPKLVQHVLQLVDTKFYDGILFHRKVPGFVLQSGDPTSRSWTPARARAHPGPSGGTEGLGDGGSGKPVPFEINNLVHDKYAVGMALESPMDDSGDSQFFINLENNYRLNGMYEVFGRIVQGHDVLAKTQRGDRIRSMSRLTN